MFVSEKEIEVRYAETDQMGVVYHANYLVWMEIGRTSLIQDLGYTYNQLEAEGYVSPVTDLNIQYKKAVKYGDRPTVRTWVETHGKLRTVYGYEIIHEDGTLAATAQSEHVVIRKDNLRPVPLSKLDPEWNAKYMEIARSSN